MRDVGIGSELCGHARTHALSGDNGFGRVVRESSSDAEAWNCISELAKVLTLMEYYSVLNDI